MSIEQLAAAVDRASAELLHEPKPRGHIGPSTLSGACLRAMYYSYRWAAYDPNARQAGDMARLLSRGHDEEHKVVRWLRAAGAIVYDYTERLMYHDGSDSYTTIPWDDPVHPAWLDCDDVSEDPVHIRRATERGQGPRQWGFVGHKGHYAGSCDGVIGGLEKWLPDARGYGLLECKTSSEKNFTPLAGVKGKWDFATRTFTPRQFNPKVHGLRHAKPDHYRQMQTYMLKLGLQWGLYCAVNKNTDEIYYEFVPLAPEVGARQDDIAQKIIDVDKPPEKRWTDPTNFNCKVCEFAEICHYDGVPARNCRTCVFSEPVEGGQWRCRKFDGNIPEAFQVEGCSNWEPVE